VTAATEAPIALSEAAAAPSAGARAHDPGDAGGNGRVDLTCADADVGKSPDYFRSIG
jgi:hypothetical protein